MTLLGQSAMGQPKVAANCLQRLGCLNKMLLGIAFQQILGFEPNSSSLFGLQRKVGALKEPAFFYWANSMTRQQALLSTSTAL